MLRVVKHQAITRKSCRGTELYLHAFLTSALDGGGWSTSRSGRITPTKNSLVTHWKRGWVTQARYKCDSEEEPFRNLNSGRPSQSSNLHSRRSSVHRALIVHVVTITFDIIIICNINCELL
jgi:hypothetical protein